MALIFPAVLLAGFITYMVLKGRVRDPFLYALIVCVTIIMAIGVLMIIRQPIRVDIYSSIDRSLLCRTPCPPTPTPPPWWHFWGH